jgi:large subunit ribosomal protein L7/L12
MATITREEIKEAIKSMTVLELAQLVKELEEEFGVSAGCYGSCCSSCGWCCRCGGSS